MKQKLPRDWVNTLFIIAAHVGALVGVIYLIWVRCSPWTIALGLLWFALCGVGITGGYHRLFSHPTYKARWPVKLLYLVFGAASVQNSALKWSADHRAHHAKTDTEKDPYNIRAGFWWAHIGWVFRKGNQEPNTKLVKDLSADRLVRWQHEHYTLIALFVGAILPTLIGFAWGDPIGAFLTAGMLRLVIQWHATFAVNSFAHTFGRQPFTTKNSARDSFWTALITLGEGYHNFHHRFQSDYRNGVRWFHFDPTKWWVWLLSRIGMTWDLKRTPPDVIAQARERAREERLATRSEAA